MIVGSTMDSIVAGGGDGAAGVEAGASLQHEEAGVAAVGAGGGGGGGGPLSPHPAPAVGGVAGGHAGVHERDHAPLRPPQRVQQARGGRRLQPPARRLPGAAPPATPTHHPPPSHPLPSLMKENQMCILKSVIT